MCNVVAGLICDPEAVSIAHKTEEGAQFTMRIGGKVTSSSGDPSDFKVVVERIYKDITLPVPSRIAAVPCDAAVVRCGEAEIVLTSKRINAAGLQPIEMLGLDPKNKQYVLLKYCSGFDNDDDGWFDDITLTAPANFSSLSNFPFSRVVKPKWPWNETPFDISGENGEQ